MSAGGVHRLLRQGGFPMAFQLGLRKLANFSDQLAVMLSAGITLRQALATGGRKVSGGLQDIYRRLGTAIEEGDSFSQALEKERGRFPVMFRRLVLVGEETGSLDAVLRRIGEYYNFVRRVRNRLLVRLAWPIFEYWFAVVLFTVVAIIGQTMGISENLPGVFKNLSSGMVLFAGSAVFFGPIIFYFVVKHFTVGTRILHVFLMGIPGIGGIIRTLALARFTWCMELTTEAGVHILDAIRWSLEATGNQVFIARGKRIIDDIKGGMQLPQAFARSRLFPEELLEFVETGSASGQLPDMFRRLSKMYFDKAEHALQILGTVLFVFIFLLVAGVLAYFIISFYVDRIQEINNMIGG